MKVSFYPGGRTGNHIFQFLASKIIEHLHGHNYCSLDKWDENETKNALIINETLFSEILSGFSKNKQTYNDLNEIAEYAELKNKDIILSGYFQKSEYYAPYRDFFINHFFQTDQTLFLNDYWVVHGVPLYFQNIMIQSKHSILDLTKQDIVMHLRLDDFIQMPCPMSDILPPQYYLDILENHHFRNLYIVCDRIRHSWEHQYLKYFEKWNPVLVQNTVEHDIALMRDAPFLIHSNSTLSWLSSFFSRSPKRRIIPRDYFYSQQNLNIIDHMTDTLLNVNVLSHHEVYHLNPREYNDSYIHPLPYSIPDELILSKQEHLKILENKTSETAFLIPGQKNTYLFGFHQEKEYNEMYRQSKYAFTFRKGGWDCLRHYEILANGCIPIFENIQQCPKECLISYPKQLLIDCYKELFKDTQGKFIKSNDDNHEKGNKDDNPNKETIIECDDAYRKWSLEIMDWFREHCSTSASTRYFLNTIDVFDNNQRHKSYMNAPDILSIKKRLKRVLLIRGNIGVNYTREMFWIGLKRFFEKENLESNEHTENDTVDIETEFVEYPKIDYLYDSFPEENKNGLVGNGFTYSRKLTNKENHKENIKTTHEIERDIIEKTLNHYWDMIIFGKVGPDEGWEGTIPQMPLWEHVFKRYAKNQIVFLYGGDESINLTHENRYNDHIRHHSKYGHCFVRELVR